MGGEHSLEISAPQLLWFGIDSTLNIFPQTIAQSLTYLNDEAVYRTAPATPGLLKINTQKMFFIVTEQWEIYRPFKLRQDCKLSKLFMYLKRAPASSGRALLRWGMSLGPSAAGGSPTSAALFLFSKVHVKQFLTDEKLNISQLCNDKHEIFSL